MRTFLIAHKQLTDAVFTPVAYFSVTCSSNIIKLSLFKVILVQKYVDDGVGYSSAFKSLKRSLNYINNKMHNSSTVFVGLDFFHHTVKIYRCAEKEV